MENLLESGSESMRAPFQLIPEYREYVWGGHRLRSGRLKTAEAWVVYEGDRVAAGPFVGRTLAEFSDMFGEALLGTKVVRQTGKRFPLLIKLLDCAEWLSLQVHPDDEQAERLEGPGHFGKTEAWYIVEADPGARLIAGIRPGITPDSVKEAIQSGHVVDVVEYHTVHAGDSMYMPAGTIHALGPGLLIYEVQQTSDITYRVYDWDRPSSAGRALHIEQSIHVTRSSSAALQGPPPDSRPDPVPLVHSPLFSLYLVRSGAPIWLDTGGETFHALTVVDGSAIVESSGARFSLSRFESAVVPAACDSYLLNPSPGTRVLLARGAEH